VSKGCHEFDVHWNDGGNCRSSIKISLMQITRPITIQRAFTVTIQFRSYSSNTSSTVRASCMMYMFNNDMGVQHVNHVNIRDVRKVLSVTNFELLSSTFINYIYLLSFLTTSVQLDCVFSCIQEAKVSSKETFGSRH